jgi:nitroreductase
LKSLIEYICGRRSVSPKHLHPPGPKPEQLNEMVRAACAGIDHGRLAPTRFIYITEENRPVLADAFAAAAVEAQANAAQQAAARERAMAGPCLLAVIARIDNQNTIPVHEQWIAVGAALQNLMLAISSLKFAAKVVSGKRVLSEALRVFFRLGEEEHLVGFVAIGTTEELPRELPRKSPEETIDVL